MSDGQAGQDGQDGPAGVPGGVVVLPEGERILHRSELFDVRVTGKHRVPGITRDRHLLMVHLLEGDPMVQQEATVEVAPEVYVDVEVGEQVMLRLYAHDDGSWKVLPPLIDGSTDGARGDR